MVKRLIDVILSRLVEFSVILCWHGLWTSMDIVMEDAEMMNLTHAESAWGSLVIGWPLGLFLFFIQFPLLVTYQHCKHFITKGIYYVFFQSYIILGRIFIPMTTFVNLAMKWKYLIQITNVKVWWPLLQVFEQTGIFWIHISSLVTPSPVRWLEWSLASLSSLVSRRCHVFNLEFPQTTQGRQKEVFYLKYLSFNSCYQ